MAKDGNATLTDLLDEFKKDEREDIDVISVSTKVAMSSCEIPAGTPNEITVVVLDYRDFTFTIGEDVQITKICGIDKDDWDGETVNTPVSERPIITITATPNRKEDEAVTSLTVNVNINSNKEITSSNAFYLWKQGTAEPSSIDTWDTLSLTNNGTQDRTGEVPSSQDASGSYTLWIKASINGKTSTKSFGIYKFEEVPTVANLIGTVTKEQNDESKGIATLGSNKTFAEWTLKYSINGGDEVTIPQNTTTEVNNIVKGDTIVLKYVKGSKVVSTTLNTDLLKIAYKLKYSAEGATKVPTDETKYDISSFTVDTKEPEKDGFIFDGWKTNSDGTGTKYVGGDSITIDTANHEVTLYAEWRGLTASDISFTPTDSTWKLKYTENGQEKEKAITNVKEALDSLYTLFGN